MRITFEQQDSAKIGNQRSEQHREIRGSRRESVSGALFRTGETAVSKNWMERTKDVQGKGTRLLAMQQETGMNAEALQDYRVLLSHTMSSEDYARMEEEGFDFARLNPEEAVTIVDKIKAELARSGQYVAGYTDDLDRETLSAALGDEALASAVYDSFRRADVPLTKENAAEVKRAWDMASELTAPNENTYRYMTENEMEPMLQHFYLAQNSGTAQAAREKEDQNLSPRFYEEDIPGYYMTGGGEQMDEARMETEIDRILVREGLDTGEENHKTARQLLAEGIPLTRGNITRRQALERVSFPVSREDFASAAASAAAMGKDPVSADLSDRETIYDKAVRVLDFYLYEKEGQLPPENLAARRQLEEVRLRMTAEVNVKLIRSGFAIDTAPMEELVEALRRAEGFVAETYFPGDEEAVSKYELYQKAGRAAAELPGLPARLLGTFPVADPEGTLSAFYSEGKGLQRLYESARESYEALWTAPRKDLGDHIRKAFANVDAILEDLSLELTEENRRAVRILGYNRMAIDTGNVERVRAADRLVQSVIQKMTPSSVLKMIRDGVNPLEKTFEELKQYFEAASLEYETEAESYSRFLYGLEKNQTITAPEREAYIGVYRLLHQLEISDGAAVGALVNTGAKLQFANLLSAVRSGKFKSMDVTAGEDFGRTVEILRKGDSISDQIARGFAEDINKILTEVSTQEETETYYRQERMEELRQAALSGRDSAGLLHAAGMPVNAEHLLAAQALLDSASNPFQEWQEKRKQQIERLPRLLDQKEVFQEECTELAEGISREAQQMSLTEADRSVDVRRLRLLHKQLSVAAGLARQEDYIFPMYIGKDLAKVRLTLDRDGSEKGRIDITVSLPGRGQLEAHLWAQDESITGFLAGNTGDTVMKLEQMADIFSDLVKESGTGRWKNISLSVTERQQTAFRQRPIPFENREVPDGSETDTEVENTELYRIAGAFLKAVQK